MDALSPKRKRILDFITSFVDEKGYAPSARDVASAPHQLLSITSMFQRGTDTFGVTGKSPGASASVVKDRV